MPAAIFNSSAVKILKDILRTKSGTDIITTTTNPLTVGYVGAIGSMLLKTDTAQVFKKYGSNNTDWIEMLDTMAATNINYCLNGLAIKDTTGWSTYADAASARPEDGTGGSPSITFTRNTTTPLYQNADFAITKGTGGKQGQGVAYTVGTFYPAHFTKVMKVAFDYKCSSGFSFANNDLTVWVYDITNSTLIQIQPNYFDGSGKFLGEFQTTATGASYRILFHIGTANATDWTVNIDNVFMGPQDITYANLGERQYDLTVTGTNWVTNRAVGIPYKTLNGNWRLKFNISGYLSIGTNAFTGTIAGVTFKNMASGGGTGTAWQVISATLDIPGTSDVPDIEKSRVNPNTSNFYIETTTSSFVDIALSADVELESMPTWAVDTTPIQLGTAETTRAVNARYHAPRLQVFDLTGASYQLIDFSIFVYDSHKAVTTGPNWRYDCKVTGKYDVAAFVNMDTLPWSASNPVFLKIFKNGIEGPILARPIISATYTGYLIVAGSTTIDLMAGDYIDIRIFLSRTGGGTCPFVNNPDYNWVTIVRQSGQAAIAASEKVVCTYGRDVASANTSIASLAMEQVDFNIKYIDTHNIVTIGTNWNFATPKSGPYFIFIYDGLISMADQKEVQAYIRVNGTGSLLSPNGRSSGTTGLTLTGAGLTLNLTQGDVITCWLFNGDTVARTPQYSNTFVSIHSI